MEAQTSQLQNCLTIIVMCSIVLVIRHLYVLSVFGKTVGYLNSSRQSDQVAGSRQTQC